MIKISDIEKFSEVVTELRKNNFLPGKLMKLVGGRKVFWVDGTRPAVIIHLSDDNCDELDKFYISGKNGHKEVEENSVLLFLGFLPIKTKQDTKDEVLNEHYVLKWLYKEEIIFWSFEDLDGNKNSKLNKIFELVETVENNEIMNKWNVHGNQT